MTPGAPSDEERLAWLLVRMWSLASGRTVRADVPPDQLTEEELIGFWADDFTVPSGRHAAAGATADRARIARPRRRSA